VSSESSVLKNRNAFRDPNALNSYVYGSAFCVLATKMSPNAEATEITEKRGVPHPPVAPRAMTLLSHPECRGPA
jgi:hypothetical protein